MLLKNHEKYEDKTVQTRFYTSKCQYCGRLFIKTENKTCYCSDKCRRYAHMEQQAKHMRRKRRLISNGELLANHKKLGTGRLGSKPRSDFNKEHTIIKKELGRLKK